MKMKLLVFLLFLVKFCDCARILGLFNHPGASHTFLGKVLLKHLTEKGHEVVMISSFPMKEPIPNYTDISLPENLADLQRREMMYFAKDPSNSFEELKNMTLQHTENTFKNPKVQELLKSGQTFDVIIMDWFFNEASLIFGHIFNAPVIYSSSFGNNILLNDVTGNTLPFSYVPGAGLPIDDDMSFKYRAIMTIFNIFNEMFIPRRNAAHYEILKRYFDNPPTIEKLKENVALVLSNSHYSFETPRPYTPNIIPIGGFHVGKPKELPQKLKAILDNSKTGVIYFSLGSQIKSSNIDPELISKIAKVLGRLPYTVVWKYEADDYTNFPKNIEIVKWVPQVDVLAHTNVKYFITHGGMLSLIEAVHFGVPILCIPFNGDQFTNAAFAESREIGLKIIPKEITEEKLYNILQDLINNEKYRKKMNYRSRLLREQPMNPLDVATFWVEHVIIHRGATHLKTLATKLPWYQYYLLDVIGLFLGILLVFYLILSFIVRKIFLRLFRFLIKSPKLKIT